MQLLALFKTYLDGDGNDVFVFMAICDTIEACYTVIKNTAEYFTSDKVFIGDRSDYRDNRIPYVIEEVTLNPLY